VPINTTKAKLATGARLRLLLPLCRTVAREYVAMQGWDFLVFDGEQHAQHGHRRFCRARRPWRDATRPSRPTNRTSSCASSTAASTASVLWVNTPEASSRRSVRQVRAAGRARAGRHALPVGARRAARHVRRALEPQTLVVVHIETQEWSTPSRHMWRSMASMLFLGPTDLSQSLGHPGQPGHPDVLAAMERVAAVVVPSIRCWASTPGRPPPPRPGWIAGSLFHDRGRDVPGTA
jgi:4-hydroxy-2-oxoheptanedioate aldolase